MTTLGGATRRPGNATATSLWPRLWCWRGSLPAHDMAPELARGDLRPYKRAPLHRRSERGRLIKSPKIMSQAIELTKVLIARRSVTPADEGCQQIMTERLAAAGFRVERLSFGNVENFWARRGADPRRGAVRPRSGRQEERTCGDGHRQRGVRRGAPRSQGLDRISHHER